MALRACTVCGSPVHVRSIRMHLHGGELVFSCMDGHAQAPLYVGPGDVVTFADPDARFAAFHAIAAAESIPLTAPPDTEEPV
jgi:hypothetical protein